LTKTTKIGNQTIYYDKAESLQLNCTQFSSLGIFVSKNVGNQKNNLSVIKVVYWVFLVFWISNFFIDKNSQGRKLSAKKIPICGNSALVKSFYLQFWRRY
jgi:hypothetical protein